jgi:spore coat protein U-like protein
MSIRTLIGGVALALAGLAGLPAMAATATSAIPVASAVIANCAITVAPNAISGNYNQGATDTYLITQGMQFRCTKGTTYKVTLDQGQNAATGSTCAAPLWRAKSSAGLYLNYTVKYSSSNFSNVAIGCDPTQIQTETSASALTNQIGVLQVILPKGQDPQAGAYTDQMVMTVSF